MRNLLVISTFLLITFSGNTQTVHKKDEGKAYPSRSYITIDGEKIDSNFLSNKIVMYNFYFDACDACRLEMKGLNQLYDRYSANNNVVFIAITPDNEEKAKLTQERYGLKFKIISLSGKEIADLKGKTNYPTNIIVDKSGKVAFKESGTVAPEYWTTKHVMETFAPIIDNLK